MLSEPTTVRYWLDDNFNLTPNGWRVAVVLASDVDAFTESRVAVLGVALAYANVPAWRSGTMPWPCANA
ncbi:MAG: hypothetical protein JRH11_04480 [Deltaproteobacteria bacterium]|nr:hypothetical protein [Deltaproteobacteria bacterium]